MDVCIYVCVYIDYIVGLELRAVSLCWQGVVKRSKPPFVPAFANGALEQGP